MRIRPASDSDIDLVDAMRLAFLADHRGIEPGQFDTAFRAQNRAFVAERHRAGDLLTWFADDHGSTAGVVSMLVRPVPPRPNAPRTTEGYVLNLYVAPDRRRQGIGQQLLDACLAHARTNGFRRLVLHATEDGRPLYVRAGFVRSERWYELDLDRPA
jgi:ribosomal protein S18 acetylase RimI-like enzyme